MSAQDERPWSMLAHLSMFLNLLALGWTLTTLSVVILIGLVFIPEMAIISVVVVFVCAGYAAYRVSKGEDFRYPLASEIAEAR